MVRPVRLGEKVQAWIDKENIIHAVAFNNEPHRLLCKSTPMWNYSPRLYSQKYVNCLECRIVLDSGS